MISNFTLYRSIYWPFRCFIWFKLCFYSPKPRFRKNFCIRMWFQSFWRRSKQIRCPILCSCHLIYYFWPWSYFPLSLITCATSDWQSWFLINDAFLSSGNNWICFWMTKRSFRLKLAQRDDTKGCINMVKLLSLQPKYLRYLNQRFPVPPRPLVQTRCAQTNYVCSAARRNLRSKFKVILKGHSMPMAPNWTTLYSGRMILSSNWRSAMKRD